MGRIIGSNSCANCAHRGMMNGGMVCRFNPPAVVPLVGQRAVYKSEPPDTGPLLGFRPELAGTLSVFPAVNEDMRCGKHSVFGGGPASPMLA